MRSEKINDPAVRRPDGTWNYVFDVYETRIATVGVEAASLSEAERRIRRLHDEGMITWMKRLESDEEFLYATDEEHADFLLHPNTECMDREDPTI